jgi:hypothetical protein
MRSDPTEKDWTVETVRQSLVDVLPRAYSSAFTQVSVERSFRETGIWPVCAAKVRAKLRFAVSKAGEGVPTVENVFCSEKKRNSCVFLVLYDCQFNH